MTNWTTSVPSVEAVVEHEKNGGWWLCSELNTVPFITCLIVENCQVRLLHSPWTYASTALYLPVTPEGLPMDYEALQEFKEDSIKGAIDMIANEERLEAENVTLRKVAEGAAKAREAINSCFGGMGASSALWSNTPYDKGHTNGVSAALTAFDSELRAALDELGGQMTIWILEDRRTIAGDIPQRLINGDYAIYYYLEAACAARFSTEKVWEIDIFVKEVK